ncbi:MAG: serine/threonine protein kinase [Actinobacteria bacterium]|nr:serine/threonine protein kinase [Actinomycetota bacterium]
MDDGPTPDLRPGARVGSYELELVLASGVTSTTFRARHVSLGRPVALRVFHAHAFAAEPGARERAQAQAVQAGRLEHPGIAAVYDAGPAGAGMFVASALHEGPTLAEAIAAGDVHPERCAQIVAAVADALAHAHDAGIVHREVRPEAIVLGRWGNPVLRDFGVMRWSGRTGLATRAELAETLRYAAPELVLGQPATPATDLYGLAASALCCLTGAPPADGTSVAELLARRTAGPPPHLLAPTEELPDLLAAAMASDPAQRTLGLAAFAQRLTAGVARLPAELRRAPSPLRCSAAHGAGSPPAAAPATPPLSPTPPPRADATRVDRMRALSPPPAPTVRGDRRALVAATALAATAALAAFGLGRATAPGPPPPVRVGSFELVTAPLWQAGGGGVAGARVTAPVRLRGDRATATVGLLPRADAPQDPLAALPRAARGPFVRPPRPLQAGTRLLLRYATADAAASAAVAFALPTSRGTLLAECDADTPERACAALLAGVRLGGARPQLLVPDAHTAATAADALRELEVQRGTAAAELIGDAATRATAASRLAGAYRAAAERVSAPRTAVLVGLRGALAACADAYDALASALDRGSAAGYRAARARALSADRRLAAAVRALGPLGFQLEA